MTKLRFVVYFGFLVFFLTGFTYINPEVKPYYEVYKSTYNMVCKKKLMHKNKFIVAIVPSLKPFMLNLT